MSTAPRHASGVTQPTVGKPKRLSAVLVAVFALSACGIAGGTGTEPDGNVATVTELAPEAFGDWRRISEDQAFNAQVWNDGEANTEDWLSRIREALTNNDRMFDQSELEYDGVRFSGGERPEIVDIGFYTVADDSELDAPTNLGMVAVVQIPKVVGGDASFVEHFGKRVESDVCSVSNTPDTCTVVNDRLTFETPEVEEHSMGEGSVTFASPCALAAFPPRFVVYASGINDPLPGGGVETSEFCAAYADLLTPLTEGN